MTAATARVQDAATAPESGVRKRAKPVMGPAVEAAGAIVAGSALLRRCMSLTGCTERQVARALGLSRARVHHMVDQDHGTTLALHHLLRLSRRLPGLFLALVHELDQQAADLPAPGLCHDRHLHLAMRDLGEVGAELDESLADGHVDRAELEQLDRRLVKLHRTILRWRRDNAEGLR